MRKENWNAITVDKNQPFADLEPQRQPILQRILQLPDFRTGSITATYGPVANPAVIVIGPDQSPQDPNFQTRPEISFEQIRAAPTLLRGG